MLEYCNYGCAYFVLENLKPRRASFDKKSHHKKENEIKPRRSKQARFRKEQEQPKRENRQRSRRQKQKARRTSEEKQQTNNQHHFVIRQK